MRELECDPDSRSWDPTYRPELLGDDDWKPERKSATRDDINETSPECITIEQFWERRNREKEDQDE